MRLLLVTWYFPPTNTIAAVRLNELANHLSVVGHDVRVLTARNIPVSMGLSGKLPAERVVAASWCDLTRITRPVSGALRRLLVLMRPWGKSGNLVPSYSEMAGDAASAATTWRRQLRELLLFPDYYVGWIPPGLKAGRALTRDWTPDVIYASGPPFSALVLGWRLARGLGVPLVTEFRDRWSDDPYYPPGRLRAALDRWLEGRIVRGSRALVTVSEPWAETYRARFAKPVLTLYNGYDPELVDPARAERTSGGPLRVVYTGSIYPGRRDPAVLFEAIQRLGADPAQVLVEFYGTAPRHVWPIAERYGVSACVRVHPPVRQPEAVQKQLEADVLLLMQWDDPREQGNVPGKLFEYLGARRPVLLIGLEGGVPDRILTARAAGTRAQGAEQVARLLSGWMAEKQAHGSLPLLPESTSRGLSHADQFAQLPDFLTQVLAVSPTPAASRTAPRPAE
nr:glycosyltransferase [Rhodovibrio salinarum]